MQLFPRLLIVLLAGITATATIVQADDASAIEAKLIAAKAAYQSEEDKFKEKILEHLNSREDAIRKTGDKKALDALKAQRKSFEAEGEAPPSLPPAMLKQLSTARATLDKAFQVAIKDYIKMKMDEAADAAEKSRSEFITSSAFLVGTRTYLSTLKATDVKVDGKMFDKDTEKYKMNGLAIPHSIFMHPTYKGSAQASYSLPVKATAFRASVGVPKHSEKQSPLASALTFNVLLDGKSVWKSEPVKTQDAFQTCTVKVEKGKVITLVVNCPGEHGGAHAVWFAPMVIE